MSLTILALVWGTFSIVILLAFGEGLRQQMSIANQGLGKGICIVFRGQTSIPYRGLGRSRPIFLYEEDVKMLKSRISGIKFISPEGERGDNTMTYGRKNFTILVIGVYPSFEEMRSYYPERGSRFLNELDIQHKRRVVFLGNKLKEKIFGNEEAVGKTVFINNIPFLVIGVMKKKLQNSMYNGPDEEKAAIPYSTFATIFGNKQLSRMIYMPGDVNQAEAVKKEVYKVMAKKYTFDPNDSQALGIWDVIEQERSFQKIFGGIEIFMGFMATRPHASCCNPQSQHSRSSSANHPTEGWLD